MGHLATTNATDGKLATVLRGIAEQGQQGTLVSVLVRKKGVMRTGLKFNDDLVHVLLWAGFSYVALVERSLNRLQFLQGQGNLIRSLVQACHLDGHDAVQIADASEAIQEVMDGLKKVMASAETPQGAGEDEDEEEPTWTPLEVDGVRIPGAKVYTGKGSGTLGGIYLDGVKLGEVILEPAQNGRWATDSKPKTLAKAMLKSWLPVGLYVRYSLEGQDLLMVQVGEPASEAAKTAGIQVDPEAVRSLFKIAV